MDQFFSRNVSRAKPFSPYRFERSAAIPAEIHRAPGLFGYSLLARRRSIIHRWFTLPGEGVIEEIFGKRRIYLPRNTEEHSIWDTNIFSISPTVVISEQQFTRLNTHMEESGAYK